MGGGSFFHLDQGRNEKEKVLSNGILIPELDTEMDIIELLILNKKLLINTLKKRSCVKNRDPFPYFFCIV